MTELIADAMTSSPTDLAAIAAEANDCHAQARATSTVRTHRSAWRTFEAWCAAHELPALPAAPETVALYITEMARDRKVATITRHLASIAQAGIEPGTIQ